MDALKKIMIIDDEVDLCLLMRNYLLHRQYQVRYSTSLHAGIREMELFRPDILFLDNNLPDGIGWEKAAGIIGQHPDIRIYLMSGYQPNLPPGIPEGQFSMIQKPISFRDLDHFLYDNNNKEGQKG